MQEEGWEFTIEFVTMVIFGDFGYSSFAGVVDSKDWGKDSQERLEREKWERVDITFRKFALKGRKEVEKWSE